MIDTVYIGAKYSTAEYIWHSSEYDLKAIICEKNKMSDEMLTVSLVRRIDLFVIESKEELINILSELGNSYVYIMHFFGMKIPVDRLNGFQIYNVHPSKLPSYKGAHPTYWETINNEPEIGVSIHKVTEDLDEGDIIGQEVIPYYIWENDLELNWKIGSVIPSLLKKLYSYLSGSSNDLIHNSAGDYYPKVSKKDVYIDVNSDSPDLVFNKVRAEASYEGAKIVLGSNTYCLKNILFKTGHLESEYMEKDGHLYIRYRSDLIIDASGFDIISVDDEV